VGLDQEPYYYNGLNQPLDRATRTTWNACWPNYVSESGLYNETLSHYPSQCDTRNS
jgi:hypothetical protein